MLNKIKIKITIVLVLVAITAVIGISTAAIENNGSIAEAKEQLVILDSVNEKDINHELVIDNLSFMLNGVTRSKAMELGLKDKEVVTLSKDSDTAYSDTAIISFDNNMLVYNTESMLNNSINSIKDSIVTMTILLIIMLVFTIVIVSSIVSDHIEDTKIAKAKEARS